MRGPGYRKCTDARAPNRAGLVVTPWFPPGRQKDEPTCRARDRDVILSSVNEGRGSGPDLLRCSVQPRDAALQVGARLRLEAACDLRGRIYVRAVEERLQDRAARGPVLRLWHP